MVELCLCFGKAKVSIDWNSFTGVTMFKCKICKSKKFQEPFFWFNHVIYHVINLFTMFFFKKKKLYGYGSIPINTIFSGMNIHLPAILMFTRVQGFDTLPYVKSKNRQICSQGTAGLAGTDLNKDPAHRRRPRRSRWDERRSDGWTVLVTVVGKL